jgi:hypothetical protein
VAAVIGKTLGSKRPKHLLLAGLLAGAAVFAHAETWIVTLVEGDAVIIDGARRVAAVAGARAGAGAIVETSAKTALVRLESETQTSIDLGPDTRAMVSPPGLPARGGKTPQLYLLQGWAKVTSRGNTPAPGVLAPAFELAPFAGAVVMQSLKREQFVFAEAGRADVTERRGGGSTHALNAGEFLSADPSRRGSVTPRPAPGWLQKVPRAFRDALPLRAAALKDRRIEPTALPDAGYAQLEDWLAAEPDIRRPFPRRFARLAREPEFRRALQKNLAAHPEWGPVLNPPPPPRP